MGRIPAAVILMLLAIVLLGTMGCGGQEATTTAPTGQATDTTAVTTAPTTASATGTTAAASTGTTAQSQVLTLEKLSQFDGKEGRQAYVAVDGVVYDVSASARWTGGAHSACNLGAMAGQDLSELITKAPASMRSLLEKMPVVGTLD